MIRMGDEFKFPRVPSRCKRVHRSKLDENVVLGIIKEYEVEKASHAQISDKFKVSRVLVHQILKGHKQDPAFLDTFFAAKKARQAKVEAIVEVTSGFQSRNQMIWRASQIQDEVQRTADVRVKHSLVSGVLRNVFNMKYKKVKKVAYQANSDRCLILRQLYAKVMIEQLSKGKRVICIDETWISETDFRRRKWRQSGTTNSIAERTVKPRISMITAIDTDGHIYNSLTQVNTDSDVFMLFLAKLTNKLYTEDSSYKQNCILLLDGAAYHRSDEVRKFFCQIGVQIILAGPYGYDSMVCELFFSALKRVNLNPTFDKTSKM